MRSYLEGDIASKLREGSKEYDIRVKLRHLDRNNIDQVNDMVIQLGRNAIPITELAEVKKEVEVKPATEKVEEPAEEPATEEIGQPEVKAAIIEAAATHGRDKVAGVLKEFGASKLSEVKEKDYQAVVKALSELEDE